MCTLDCLAFGVVLYTVSLPSSLLIFFVLVFSIVSHGINFFSLALKVVEASLLIAFHLKIALGDLLSHLCWGAHLHLNPSSSQLFPCDVTLMRFCRSAGLNLPIQRTRSASALRRVSSCLCGIHEKQ